MEKSNVVRWGVIALAMAVFWFVIKPRFLDKNETAPTVSYIQQASTEHPEGYALDPSDAPVKPGEENPKPPEGELCTIKGDRFEAVTSSRGAALVHLTLNEKQYAGTDLVSTGQERWRSLRTTFRGPDAKSQIKFDRFPWKLEPGSDGKTCKYSYEDADVRIEKTLAAGKGPFEIAIDTKVTNLADSARSHELTLEEYSYRANADLKGSLGRQAPLATELSCAAGKEILRKGKDDFKGGPLLTNGTDRYAALNTSYFTQALVPEPGNGAVADVPACSLLAEEWITEADAAASGGTRAPATLFRAELTYPKHELNPKESLTYRQVAFYGPKERAALAHAAGGVPKLGDIIDLGTFAPVANQLVRLLEFIHDHLAFGNWGLAVIFMTIGLRTALFPLTYKSIKSTVAMRRLKPHIDVLTKKFKDDSQGKNLAMMALYKEHGVNPFGGCLPQLVQMPVWFAMYKTLQTATEMYHEKFLWFSDLSAPDMLFGQIGPIPALGPLPFLLGAFMILQQRIVPQQGMDPVQAKMMMWLMPLVFTVMMLFLPAALGLYMLTNSILGILQQLAVEKIAPRGKDEIVVVEKKKSDDKPAKALTS